MQRKRFDELEGLRGIAAIVVVIYHFLLAFYLFSFFGGHENSIQRGFFEDNLYGNPLMVFLSGTFAVAIFFALSGFVLSIAFFQVKKAEIVKKMAAKRYIRLMLPALAATLLCFFAIILGLSRFQEVVAITQSPWLYASWNFSPTLFDAVKSAVFGIFVEGASPFNNVLWTMKTEFIGSFIVFGFLLLCGTLKHRWVGYAFLIIATFNTWFLPFIAGMLIADLYSSGYFVQKKRNLAVIVPSLAALLFLGGYPFKGPEGTIYQYITFPVDALNWNMFYLSVAAVGIMWLILSTEQLGRIFRHPWISRLGKYTFSLYLVHLIVLYTVGMFVFLQFYNSFGWSYDRSVLATLILSAPVVGLAAVLFEKFVDAPSVKLSSRFANIFLGYEKAPNLKVIRRRAMAKVRKVALIMYPRAKRGEPVVDESEGAA